MEISPDKPTEIEIYSASVFYGKERVLENISLSIREKRVGFIGRNGSGKTTLLRILAGLQELKNGKVLIDGTEVAKERKAAIKKVGIIFHTTYTGDTLADMTASAGADVESFGSSPDVFFDNATYKDVSGSAKFTADETKTFMSGIEKLEGLLQNVPRDLQSQLGQNKDFVPMFQMYINAQVKQGQLPTNVNQFLQGFKKFYADRMQQQISGLKAQKALALRQDKMKQMPVFLNRAKKPLQAMLTFYKAVQQLKGFVLKKMNQAMAIGSFQQTDGGLEVTEPEGFVAVDKSGGAVKLVDRLGFSRRNLTAVSKFKK